jgi:hypothetical protein
VFVYVIALLRSRIERVVETKKAWECTFELLRDLGRVERIDIGFGYEVKTMYFNVPKSAEKML